jgi:hypothetical protein
MDPTPRRISTPVVEEFAYRPHPAFAIGLFLCGCAGAALLGYFSFHPPEGGFRSARGIELTAEQTRWLLRIAFLASLIGLLGMGSLVWVSLFSDRRVALTRRSLIVPKPTWTGISCDEIEIPFSEITGVALADDMAGVHVFRIDHAGGKICVAGNMFRSRRVFDEMVQAVTSAVERGRGAGGYGGS